MSKLSLIGLDFDNKYGNTWLKAESFGRQNDAQQSIVCQSRLAFDYVLYSSGYALEPVSTFAFYIPQNVCKISRDSANKFIMLFCISEQGISVIKWNIYDEYKTMQIHFFAWKLACYLFRFIFEWSFRWNLTMNNNNKRYSTQENSGPVYQYQSL